MKRGAALQGIPFDLEFLSEPALVVGLKGEVHKANAAAHGLLEEKGRIASLFDLFEDSGIDIASFLRRASGSTSSHVGSLTLARGEGRERFRALAARLQWAGSAETLLIVRLLPVREDQFSVLNRRLREIDRQLHQRLKENALLQEALADNRVLVRELQHRVKNNIQQMLSLIKMSAAGNRSSAVGDVVLTATRRLRAMATAQEALYQNEGAGSISAQSFLEAVVTGAASSYGSADRLDLAIADARMTSEEAHCVALIANELVTNACKYGIASDGGRISVRFWSSAGDSHLEVQDGGPGFSEETSSRSSGLTLVRALCRQIGGRFEVANHLGSRCSVQFRSALPPGNDDDAARPLS
ncbi:sensor histidine kinase [Jannaschia formosa]|uniref:sensor histidine kinase n=1 Tax=Jannaschia formosa TaxID=2259592 RepID=UPI000E1BC793|nr:sensor histidine kinase [Jannaschia formosa]TFL17248.1 sensor histidine kinase [Jannaschia formosa]